MEKGNKVSKIFVVLSLTMLIAIGLARPAQADDSTLPKKIQWQTNVYSAYQQAVNQKKPLVVFFYYKDSQWSMKLQREILSTEEVNSLSDKAVFAWIDIETDDEKKNVSGMVKTLGIDKCPTGVILDVAPDWIVERGRIVGFHEVNGFYFQLSQILLAQPSVPASARR